MNETSTSYGFDSVASSDNTAIRECLKCMTCAHGRAGGANRETYRATGYDGYNFQLCGDASCTLRSGANLNDLSCIIIRI